MKCILGKKIGMTTLFDDTKGALNVTLIACEPNTVTAHRTTDRHGYVAVQLAHPKTKRRTATKEFRLDKKLGAEAAAALVDMPVGQSLTVAQFSIGDKVNITGVTKAKGFQGVVKRHGFKGSPASHGRKHDMRKPGSIGATFPEHVIKGMRMAGRMGGENFTVRNLVVAFVDEVEGLLGVKGAVPGVAGRLVEVRSVK
jgi:large subunit ribosomal protein L3